MCFHEEQVFEITKLVKLTHLIILLLTYNIGLYFHTVSEKLVQLNMVATRKNYR